MRRLTFVWVSVIACLGLLGLGEQVFTQASQTQPDVGAAADRGRRPGEIQVLPVQGNVHVLIGAGRATSRCRPAIDGVLMVDTGMAAMSAEGHRGDAVHLHSAAALHRQHDGPRLTTPAETRRLRTSARRFPFREPNYTAGPQGALDVGRASIISYYTVLHRMSAPTGKAAPIPESGGPTTRTRSSRSGSTSTMNPS